MILNSLKDSPKNKPAGGQLAKCSRMIPDALKDSLGVATVWCLCMLVAAAIITRAMKE